MLYCIQENVFREIHYDRIVDAIRRLGLAYEIVKVGDTESISFSTERNDVFCFGSIKLSRLAQKNSWFPGSLMNENHDYTIYSKYWKEHLLNTDSDIQEILHPIDFSQGNKFIRPTKDSKIFTGKVFNQAEWAATLQQISARGKQENVMIQVANPKRIFQEIRCWIVDKQVITASTYKIGDDVRYTEFNDSDGLDFAKEMAQIYQPAKAFVIDICRTEKGWKIVEINCINSAGFYAANLQKLVIALEDYYNPII